MRSCLRLLGLERVPVGRTNTPDGPQSRPNDERGYVLATTALLLIPMLVFAALATDVGGWTVQANKTQNAADAAALAAAAFLPEFDDAKTAALEVAAKNGFVDGVDDVVIDVSFPDSTTARVTITDDSELFFGSVVINDAPEISRWADARTVTPVHMGSPSNVFGFGPLSVSGLSQVAGYWVLENNDCQVAHYGDLKAAQYDAAPFCGALGSTTRTEWKGRTEGRDGGYFFVVEVPPGVTSPSQLHIFDPGICPRIRTGGVDLKPPDGGTTDIDFRMWSSNGTPLLTTDDYPVTGLTGTDADGWLEADACPEDDPAWPTDVKDWTDTRVGWTPTPFVFPANTTGDTERWFIQTRSELVGASATGTWNHYAFWVRPTAGPEVCTSIGSTNCPTIGAEDWVALRATGAAKGQPMNLYLGRVLPEHAGKTMQVRIWDPGEGMHDLQVLDPNGKSLDFTWSSNDVTYGSDNPSDTCGANPCLLLYPNNKSYPPAKSLPGWYNHYRFNGRSVTLSVPLDAQIDWTTYPNYWFRLQFNPTATKVASEWASFAFTVTGDPIRLVD